MTKIISLVLIPFLFVASLAGCTQAQKDAAGSDVKAGETAGLACAKQDVTSVIGDVAGAFASGDPSPLIAKIGTDLFDCATKALVAVFDAVRAQPTASPTTASAAPSKIEVNARNYLATKKIK